MISVITLGKYYLTHAILHCVSICKIAVCKKLRTPHVSVAWRPTFGSNNLK